MRTSLALAMGMALALFAPSALAQDAPSTPTQPPAPAGDGALPPPKVTTQVQTTTVQPTAGGGAVAASATTTKVEEDPTSDHEKVVGHIGVGYMGLTSVPVAADAGTGIGNVIQAPVIGVRWWLAERVGLDLGLGLGLASSSTETVTPGAGGTVTTTTDAPSVFAIAFHGGVPLVLAHQKHYKFLVIPELNIARGSFTVTPANAPEVSHTGFLFNVGARIGAEIHFGFVGLPQLALQASVGLNLGIENRKQSATAPNGVETSASNSTFRLGTTVQSDPWAIFANSISALYYFP